MQNLVEEIIELRRKSRSNNYSIEQIILALGKIVEKYDLEESDHDSEKEYLKKFLKIKSFRQWNGINKKTKQKLKHLKVLMLLRDLGIDNVSESQVVLVLQSNPS